MSRLLAGLVILAACGPGGGAQPDAAVGAPDASVAGPDAASEARFPDVSAVRVAPAGRGWLVVVETLQPQLLVTSPLRALRLLGDRLESGRAIDPIPGWILIDAVGHPSGDVTAVYVAPRAVEPVPLRVRLSRHRPDGTRVDAEVDPVAGPGAGAMLLMSSLDRVRLAASEEDVVLAARWPGNAVDAYRFAFGARGFEPAWATRVEPEAPVYSIGIIGGGFDNFHQGDDDSFVYLGTGDAGDVYVAVPTSEDLLPAHDAAFGEHLGDGADPESFDFGTAILTRLDARGGRVYARLLGTPGRAKSLLGLRAGGGGAVLLVGRVKTAREPDGWDAWILSARAATGEVAFERNIDVEHGDMFWDAAVLDGQRVLAIGATGYVQNPVGLSVSDGRDALALLLDAQGGVVERLELPRGAGGRGDEAISVSVGGGVLAIAGMLDGPGTHAEVRSNGFLILRPAPAPTHQ